MTQRRTLTAAELAARIVPEPESVTVEHYEAILRDDESRGVVVASGDGYRLSDSTECKYGAALRDIYDEEE